ncbi:protein of unknown function [Magnetospirillum sp. XM-1]|nr:protein of unknown function [Magnetospirillum sp. XM-1]
MVLRCSQKIYISIQTYRRHNPLRSALDMGATIIVMRDSKSFNLCFVAISPFLYMQRSARRLPTLWHTCIL